MPVSPQDFSLWSGLTGNPYPQTPAERMALAPEVYRFTRNLNTGKNPVANQQTTLSGAIGTAVETAGRWALGLGLLTGAGLLASRFSPPPPPPSKGGAVGSPPDSGVSVASKPSSKEFLNAAIGSSSESTKPIETLEKAIPAPALTRGELTDIAPTESERVPIRRSHEDVSSRAAAYVAKAQAGYQKLELDDEPELAPSIVSEPHHLTSPTVAASGDVTPATTAERYAQDVIPNQTYVSQQVRGTSPVKPTVVASEMKPATQSDVISSRQQFSPGSELEQIGEASIEKQRAEAFRKGATYAAMKKQYEGLQPIESAPAPASAAPETLTNVQPSPVVKVARPSDIGGSLRAKGIYLSGDPESGTIQVNTEKGGTYEINHPYSTHPKSGIRETALQEEQAARGLLQSAGVTPEQAKDYWASKFAPATESPIATMAAPARAAVAPVTAAPSAVDGPSATEIRDLDTLLARSHAGHTPEQRLELRNQVLSKKYGGGGPIVTTTQPAEIRVAREETPITGPSPESVRFARETARGMSRIGLMGQREEGRAQIAGQAQYGSVPANEPAYEPGEGSADPSLMRALLRRPTTIQRY